MKHWKHCIVTFIDLIGITAKLEADSKEAVRIMRKMYEAVFSYPINEHEKVYVWNDSVVLLANVDGRKSFESLMREANAVKCKIDLVCPCFAISIKGKPFPMPRSFATNCHYLEMSSLAFTNCFQVQAEFSKRKKEGKPTYAWYIDSRIKEHIGKTAPFEDAVEIKVYPPGVRKIFPCQFDDLYSNDIKL